MQIKYDLRGVTVGQFATIFEAASSEIEFNLTIPLKANYFERMLAVGANIQFSEDGKTFLVAEVFCHFEIQEDSWKELSNDNSQNVVIPRELMNVFSRIAIGTLRGVLTAKTENTPFSKFFIPIIEIQAPKEKGDFVWLKP